MRSQRATKPILLRPLWVAVALGLMVWGLVGGFQDPTSARTTPGRAAGHGQAGTAIREAR